MNAEIEYEQDSWTCTHGALPDGHIDRDLKVCPGCGSTVYWQPSFLVKWRLVKPYNVAGWVARRAEITNLEIELTHSNDPERGPSTTARFKPARNPQREVAWAPTPEEAILLLARSMYWIDWQPVSMEAGLAA